MKNKTVNNKTIQGAVAFEISKLNKEQIPLAKGLWDDWVDPDNPITKDKTITPIISSRIAALTIAVPTLVSNFPSSFKVAIVTETDVAVNIVP